MTAAKRLAPIEKLLREIADTDTDDKKPNVRMSDNNYIQFAKCRNNVTVDFEVVTKDTCPTTWGVNILVTVDISLMATDQLFFLEMYDFTDINHVINFIKNIDLMNMCNTLLNLHYQKDEQGNNTVNPDEAYIIPKLENELALLAGLAAT